MLRLEVGDDGVAPGNMLLTVSEWRLLQAGSEPQVNRGLLPRTFVFPF